MAGGGAYKVIEELSGRSPETADLLFATFVARHTSPVASLASSTLLGLANSDLREAHSRALSLSKAEAVILRRTGIGTLGSFRYPEADMGLLQATLRRFEEIGMMSDPDVNYVLARAYGLLASYSDQASRAFVEMAEMPDQSVQEQVLFILLRRADADHALSWYRESILHLAGISASQAHSLRTLDHCISRYVSDDPQFACEFLEKFVLSRGGGSEDDEVELFDLFGQTLKPLRGRNSDNFEMMVTRWFSSLDRRLHRAAWKLVGHGHYGSPDSNTPLTLLSKAVLDSLDEESVIFTLAHVLGYGISGVPLAAIIVSALRREPLVPEICNFIEDA